MHEIATRSLALIKLLFVYVLSKEVPYLEYQAEIGGTITLDCALSPDSFTTIEWYRNSTELIAKKDGISTEIASYLKERFDINGNSLLIQNSKAVDEAIYHCETIHNQSSVKGKPIKLILEERPTCGGSQTKLIEVINGSSFYIPCHVNGNPYPKITWKKDDMDGLPQHFTITGDGLSCQKVNMDDSGKYSVTLENEIGRFTFTTVVKVISVGSIKPENYKSAVEGSSVEIECGKSPLNPGDKVSWSKNRIDLSNMKRFSTNDQGFLIINPVEQDDNGLYTCASQRMIDEAEVTRSVNMYLNVKFAPHIISIKSVVEVYEGENAVLPCSASGNPGVNFRWLDINGKEIKNNEKLLIAHNGSLIVRNVTLDDFRRYTCAPYNDIGEGKFGYTDLFVLVPPTFITHPENKTLVREGENATLDCTVSGIPKPNISWALLFGDKVLDPNRFRFYSNGIMNILNVRSSDAAYYKCTAESRAGRLTRISELTVISKPGVPIDIKVTTTKNIAHIEWTPPYHGGSPLNYQFWYRYTTDSDYQWVIQESEQNGTSYDILLPGPAEESEKSYFFTMRAFNQIGFSDFGTVVKVLKAPSFTTYKGQPVDFISEFPLAPFEFYVNVSVMGYVLKWRSVIVPGRPAFSHVLIEYRKLNSTDIWVEIKPRSRKRRSSLNDESIVTLRENDFPPDIIHPVDFQLIAVSKDGKRSEPVVPKNIAILGGVPGKNTLSDRSSHTTDDENSVIPIILGIIFGIFIIILLIGLLHLYRRRKVKHQVNKAQNKSSLQEFRAENGTIDLEMDLPDETSLLKRDPSSPRHFHLLTCPALNLERTNENHNGIRNEKNSDVTHALLEPNHDEKRLCTCSKSYVTLDRRDQVPKRDKKKTLYKSNSMPSILITSDLDDSTIDPLEDEEYETSDVDKDKLTELNQERFHSLKRSNFKDSYDQFCRGDSETTSRNDTNHRKVSNENINHFDNLSDVSENQKFHSIKKSTRSGVKSSGFGDGSNSTSDSESVDKVLLPFKSRNMGSSKVSTPDVGYASDVSARSMAFDYNGRVIYQPPSQRHKYGYNRPYMDILSDDERHIDDRPAMPPSYSEAIQVIERLSEKNDITDSEEMYDQLLQMERQLGLDDSIDSDLNSKSIFSPPISRTLVNMKSGYSSDTGLMSNGYSAPKNIYSDREKNERCKQLLNEFKSSRSSCSDSSNRTNITILPPYERSHSAMDNMVEEPSPPTLKRSNSIGSNSVYKEWLV